MQFGETQAWGGGDKSTPYTVTAKTYQQIIVYRVPRVKLTVREFVCYIKCPRRISGSDIEDILRILWNRGAEVLVLLKLVYQEKCEVGVGHGLELLLI